MSTPSKDREPLRLKIADWVDDYAETLLGSEYSGRIDRGECLDGLLDLFYEQLDSLKQSLVAEMPNKYEPEFTRTSDGDLMCMTCGSDVFGGLCACGVVNAEIDQFNTIINRVFNGRM